MGALHEGHLSLVQASLKAADETIVTIFVNPTQFAPHEDFGDYPKTMESDLNRLAEVGEVLVFAPPANDIYPPGFSTAVKPPIVANVLEGEFRPAHFAGVATVVLKLINLTRADWAFFGQKDYQQQLVVKRMVEDLNVPTEIRVCPIVRESDGLALSSRNVYLSKPERATAAVLNETLRHVEKEIRDGAQDAFELTAEMNQRLIDGGVSSVDYATIADPRTLDPFDEVRLPAVVLIAAYVGRTRLIDNLLVLKETEL